MRYVIIQKGGERQQVAENQLADHEADGWKLIRRTTVLPPEHASHDDKAGRWIVDDEQKAAVEHSNDLMNKTERDWRVEVDARISALQARIDELTKKG